MTGEKEAREFSRGVLLLLVNVRPIIITANHCCCAAKNDNINSPHAFLSCSRFLLIFSHLTATFIAELDADFSPKRTHKSKIFNLLQLFLL
jgi:hypothetical protein